MAVCYNYSHLSVLALRAHKLALPVIHQFNLCLFVFFVVQITI